MTAVANTRPTMIGPVGRTVIANVERLREARGMSLRDLSVRLTELGRPIGGSVLHRQSQGERRIDADDLVAFARVFGITPAELLQDHGAAIPGDKHPAVSNALVLADRIMDLIAAAGDSEATARSAGQVDRALRRVQIEIEELLDAQAPAKGD